MLWECIRVLSVECCDSVFKCWVWSAAILSMFCTAAVYCQFLWNETLDSFLHLKCWHPSALITEVHLFIIYIVEFTFIANYQSVILILWISPDQKIHVTLSSVSPENPHLTCSETPVLGAEILNSECILRCMNCGCWMSLTVRQTVGVQSGLMTAVWHDCLLSEDDRHQTVSLWQW